VHKVFLTQKRIISIMLGIGPRNSCIIWFKKLDLLMVPSLYVFIEYMNVSVYNTTIYFIYIK